MSYTVKLPPRWAAGEPLARSPIHEKPVTAVTPVTSALPQRLPAGAILLAPRFDGLGRPLAEVPRCWCCAEPYRLDRVEEWKGKTYTYLEPWCGCLVSPQALSCCGLCTTHCRCRGDGEASDVQ